MAGRVLSVNLGAAAPNPAKTVRSTGIGKQPVESAEVRAPGPKKGGLGSGLVGDFIGDVKHHGGDDQAVYAFAREELDHWERELGREILSGTFGENLTTVGIDVDDARVGDRWAVGDEVLLEATGPRIPCATFNHRMGVRGWLKRFTLHGRSGAYLAVVVPGTIRAGDEITVVHRADHDITLPLYFRALMGDVDAARTVVESGVVPEMETAWLRDQVIARG